MRTTALQNLLVGGGKTASSTCFDPGSLGRGAIQNPPLQAAHACDNPAFKCYQIHSIPYLGGVANPMLYVWASHEELRSFRWDPGTRTFGAVATNSMLAGYPGGMLAVSSQAGAAGTSILWAVDTNGVVRAYDAFNVANEIWNSSQIANDALGKFSKFGQPVVADGTLFVPTFSNTVVAYGLLPQSPASGSGQPAPAPAPEPTPAPAPTPNPGDPAC